MNNPIRRTRPEKTGVRAPLGELELEVMRHIWSCSQEGCQGSEVQGAIQKARPIALTTVLTTLDRLFDKGILYRQREGKAYRYRPALSEEQLQQRIVEGVMNSLIAQFPEAVAAYLSQQGLCAADQEGKSLAELARQVGTLKAGHEGADLEDVPDVGSQ